jgi:hypothetical protein
VAATAAWINPLTTVLLSGLPLLLADIRNITALTSHGVLDQAATRQIQELSVAYHLVRQGARPRMLNKTRRIHGSWFW